MNSHIDPLTLANLVFSSITTICALYLSYAALKHSARPNVNVKMRNSNTFECSQTILFVFEFTNVGHWYAKPTAIDVVAFCNFDPAFKLIELRYGSIQSYTDTDVKLGVGKMIYLKAEGLKLTYGEEGEEVHVEAVIPKKDGQYQIRISAFSQNGVSIKKEFTIRCRQPKM